MAESEQIESINVEQQPGSRKKVVAVVLAIILIAAAAAIALLVGSSAYKRPINQLIKGLNKADSLRVMSAAYSEDYISDLERDMNKSGGSWEQLIDDGDSAIQAVFDSDGIKKLSIDIRDKEQLQGSNLEEISHYYDFVMAEEVTKAYRVEVGLEVRTKGGKETRSGWICVAKLKGDSWRYCPVGGEGNLNIDEFFLFEQAK